MVTTWFRGREPDENRTDLDLGPLDVFTVGYVRDLLMTSDARLGVGGDVTGYLVPENFREAYGAPVSFLVFLRYRPGNNGRAAVAHVH